MRLCKKGRVYYKDVDHQNSDNKYSSGLKYEQGGYPVLHFGVKKGYYFISSRSDPSNFISKGGCSIPDTFDDLIENGCTMYQNVFDCSYRCSHPNQKLFILWLEKIDSGYIKPRHWQNWQYMLKWSEYNRNGLKKHGIVKIWLNNRLIVDFTGPIGRNDARTPYFKSGVYNPDHEPLKTKVFLTNYNHTVQGGDFKMSPLNT